jgi:predicted transposase YbfD/YdcC
VLTVKGNQGAIREQLDELFKHVEEKFPELLYSFEQTEKRHGRLEHREISVLATEHTTLVFPDVKQVARLRRTREVLKSGAKSEEEIFLITNRSFEDLDAEAFANLKRSYWDIENKLHYRKDFVFGEDRSTIRKGHGPQNMSSLRNFALGLLLNLGITNVKRCVDNLRHDPLILLRSAIAATLKIAA